MKIAYRKLIKSLSSILLLLSPFTPSQSCGPDIMPNEGRFCVFRPEMGQKTAWTPFFYSEEWLNSYIPDPEKTDLKRNIREWLAYLNAPVEESDIYELLYLTESDDFLYASETNNWEKFETNTFVQFLRKPENAPVMAYILNAKQNEFIQNFWSEENAWNDLASKEQNLMENYQQNTKVLLEKTSDPFLKQRYAFLLIRSSWNDSQKYDYNIIMAGGDIRSLYNQYLKGKNTVVADWANIYLAPFYLENCDTLRYHYTLMNAFDKTEEKKVAAFSRMYKSWLPDLLNFVKTPHEKAVVYTLMSLRNPGKALHELKSASKLDPQLSYLPLLITREINKLEDWLLSPSILNFDSFLWQEQYNYETDQYEAVYEKNREKDLEYLRMFRSFLETLRPSASLPQPYLQNAIAHLYILDGKFEKAKKALNEISPQSAPEFLIQKNIENVICTAHLSDITKPETKEILAKELKALEKSYKALYPDTKAKNNEYDLRYYNDGGRDEWKDDMDELYVWLSRLYQDKGETVTAGLLYMKAKILVNEYDGGGYYSMDYYDEEADTVMANQYFSIAYLDRYASPEQVEQWMSLKNTATQTAFEKFISPEKWTSDEMLLDVKGTILIRQGRYEEAYNTFARLPEDFWEKTYEFKDYLPATSIRYSPILPYNEEETGKKSRVSKARLAKELWELSEAVKKADNPDIAKAWYDYGMGLYNLTYDGNAWMMFSYGKSSRELESGWSENYRFAFYDFEPNATRYREEYYGAKKASDAFQKAYVFAHNNPETAAKANVMLYVCGMQSYNNLVIGNHYYYDEKTPDVPANTKFLKSQLKQKFHGTKTFEIISSTCMDFED